MNEQSHYRHYLSPIVGWLNLRVSDKGVRSISYIDAPASPLESTDHPIMETLVRELDRYFRGELESFSVPPDPDGGTPFQRKVWKQLIAIPYGRTASYSDIAAAVGNPKAARAVGSANGNNGIPILIPCHRVIKADGGIGGYASGTPIKKALLKLEGTRLP